MKILIHILRVIVGLFFLMSLGALFGLMPMPTAEMYQTAEGWNFIKALMDSGYMLYLINLTGAVCGVLLLANRVALAAVLLAPLTVNIIAFHIFLEKDLQHLAAIPAWVLLISNVLFLWHSWPKYRNIWS